jgi:hypothetical protein
MADGTMPSDKARRRPSASSGAIIDIQRDDGGDDDVYRVVAAMLLQVRRWRGQSLAAVLVKIDFIAERAKREAGTWHQRQRAETVDVKLSAVTRGPQSPRRPKRRGQSGCSRRSTGRA